MAKSLLLILVWALHLSCAFVVRPGTFARARATDTRRRIFDRGATTLLSALSSGLGADGATALPAAEAVKSAILEEIRPTKRGLSTTPEQRASIEGSISKLEGLCPVEAPARDSRMEGHWFVRYTTAPPPSNGQLGPFVGVAAQEIGLSNGRYSNILSVGPNNWLGATLDADWTEWDGQLLEEKDEEGRKKWMEGAVEVEAAAGGEEPVSAPDAGTNEDGGGIFGSIMSALSGGGNKQKTGKGASEPDYGASSWRVTFDSLTIRLFGLPVVTKKFDDTARVWKMTYIDDDTRIVRAGRTGKSEDDVVFYMTREMKE